MDLKLKPLGSSVELDYRVWVVVNNHTLTIYMDEDDLNTIYKSYNLDQLKINKANNTNCILL